MVKKIKIEFKVGDIVRVSVQANYGVDDFYGEIVQEDILIGFSIPCDDMYGPYFLVKGVSGEVACVSKENMSETIDEELDAEIRKNSEAAAELQIIIQRLGVQKEK